MNITKEYMKKHPIECFFFSEFHHKQGPKITYQYPLGSINRESSLLEAAINYIIPKPDLQDKLITVNAVGKKVIGCPVCINDPKYPRNQYMFNFGMVLDNVHKSSPCIPLIKKLASYMTELELESYFVSNEKSKEKIPGLLEQIFTELNNEGSCCIPVTEATSLYLKVFPPTVAPSHVYDHHVPILTVPKDSIILSEWDLTTQQILPFIDGFRHVQKIGVLADVDVDLAKICIQNLAFYKHVRLISIFQYSNVYITTAKLNKFWEDTTMQHACLDYVSRSGHQKPTLHDVMTLYCGLAPRITLRDLCNMFQDQITRVNEQRLIEYGLIHGLIRRINMFPVRLKSDRVSLPQSDVRRYTDGLHSAEEICCKLGSSHSELLAKLEMDRDIVTCWK
uniref:Nitrogen permease regulator 2-like protein n=1 Tax=Ciona savignyi TaxID=51511 RepID=H2YTV6_CIOSA